MHNFNYTMTSEMVKEYQRYWREVEAALRQVVEREQDRDRREVVNDHIAKAADMVIICELALCQLFNNEERKKGVPKDAE